MKVETNFPCDFCNHCQRMLPIAYATHEWAGDIGYETTIHAECENSSVCEGLLEEIRKDIEENGDSPRALNTP